MSWGESRRARITILCCREPGCGFKLLVGAKHSTRFCPTHGHALERVLYEQVQAPARSEAVAHG